MCSAPTPRRRRSGRSRAFTLIEVLVVVAIIALLVAILIPSLTAARRQARSAACLSNMKNIGSSMGMYQGAHRGWLPVGPADRIRYRDMSVTDKVVLYETPPPNSRPWPSFNCAWGGKRAAYPHDFMNPARPEVLKRPLTDFIYKRAGLDADMPLFHCPDDNGAERKFLGWMDDPALKSSSMYEICGNSYWTNAWDDNRIDPSRKRPKTTSTLIVAEEAPAYYSIAYEQQVKNWHGRHSRHNFVFLDFHAANLYIDPRRFNPLTGQNELTRTYMGPGWYAVNYFEIMDYYRW
ncbi:MAG: prepilin-type N-terminal cleavage/methylation domain-containing protein [Phycisphaerae bacterium]|jgi:prepilin-type N-terminal cleavage/methylation domain-containing protein